MTLARINMTGDTVMFSPLRDAASDAAAAAATAAAAEAAKNVWVPAVGAPGYDADTIGHLQNKGWDKLPAGQAALEGAKAHRAAERLIGVSTDRLLTLPKEATDEVGWQNVWTRLGAPKEAKDYDFATVKFTDGTTLDKEFEDTIRAAAFKNHMPAAAAQDFANSIVKLVEANDKADVANNQNIAKLENDKLITDWGASNVETNLVLARAVAQKLGPAYEAAFKTLEAQKDIGWSGVAKLLHRLSTSMGEDTLIRNLNGGGAPVLTKEQAGTQLADKQNDALWRQRFLAGGVAEKNEFEALTRIKTQT